jgi:hypothetical protein
MRIFATWGLTNKLSTSFHLVCLGTVLRLWTFLQGMRCASFTVLFLDVGLEWSYDAFTSLMIASLFVLYVTTYCDVESTAVQMATLPRFPCRLSFHGRPLLQLPWPRPSMLLSFEICFHFFLFAVQRGRERKSTWCFSSSECQ